MNHRAKNWQIKVMAVGVALAAGLAAFAAHAGQFYMANSRIFKPGEKMRVYLSNYSGRPMEFRLYRIPDPVKYLLDSRKIRAPEMEGAGEVTEPGLALENFAAVTVHQAREQLREVVRDDLRMEMAKKLDLKSPVTPEKREKVTYPILEQYELVAKFERGGEPRYGDVEIPVEGGPKAGLYLLQAISENHTGATLLMVSDLRFFEHRDRTRSVVTVVSAATGQVVPGARVLFLDEKNPKIEKLTNADGMVDQPMAAEARYRLVVALDDDAITGTPYFYDTYGEYAAYKAYIYTDRPVYRPGQTVYWKGIVRKALGADYEAAADMSMAVEITDTRDAKIFEGSVKSNAKGEITGEVTLGTEPPLGTYSISVRVGDHHYSGEFKVEEYKKPEYKVDVLLAAKEMVTGGEISGTISAQYYFGEPVVGGKVTLNIYRREYHVPWWADDEFGWCYAGEDYGPSWELIETKAGETSAEGKMAVRFKTPAEHGDDLEYRIEAAVEDKSRRQITGASKVTVFSGATRVEVRSDRYAYMSGSPVALKIKTKDMMGKPVAAKVTVKAARAWWNQNKRERTELETVTVQTDAGGQGAVTLTAPGGGSLDIEASVADSVGRVSYNELHLWIYRSGYAWGGDGALEIVMDKEKYAIGDTVKMMLISPAGEADFLVAVEGDKLYKLLKTRAQAGSAWVEIPVEPAFAPNVTFRAQAVKDGSHYEGTKALTIPMAPKFLKIALATDKPEYKPGETAAVTVRVTDHAGNPAQASLSLGIVDEAVYAIAQETIEDIRKFFYGHRESGVTNFFSSYFYVGSQAKILDTYTNLPYRGMKGGKKVEPQVRKNFKDTMFWQAIIDTDGQGKAAIKAPVPDNLTSWRITARAHTQDTKVGQETMQFIARKNLMVRLELPRFVVQNDEISAAAMIHNYLAKEKEVEVEFKAAGVEGPPPEKQKIALKPREEKRLEYKLKAKAIGTAKLELRALTDEESDALELPLPVLPHGIKQTVSGLAELRDENGAATVNLELPAKITEGSAMLTVTMAPSVVAAALAALDYLVGYPYGCVEQTMSRFLPDLVAKNVLDDLKIKNAKLDAELPKMLTAGLQRLANMQHGDGGWGWWENDSTHPFMTAYVVSGLAYARSVGVKVEERMIARGMDSLRSQLGNAKLDPATRAYMLYAAAAAGGLDRSQLDKLFTARDTLKLNNYSKALMALAYFAIKDIKRGEILEAEILGGAKIMPGGAIYWDDKVTAGALHWQDDAIETSSQAIRVLLRGGPKLEEAGKAVRWLLNGRVAGSRWRSTRDTALAVHALLEYVRISQEMGSEFKVAVKVNGQQKGQTGFGKGDTGASPYTLTVDGKSLAAGKNEIIFEKTGKGVLYASAALSYFTAEEQIPAMDSGFKVERTYELLQPAKEKDRWVYNRKPLPTGVSVMVGEEVYVTVSVTSPVEREYVMLEEPLPAGFEVIKDDRRYFIKGVSDPKHEYYEWEWGYWYAQKDVRDEKIDFFATYFPKGTRTFSYIMRAQIPGKYRALPASAGLMYYPEVTGNATEFFVDILDKP